jgi:hypothetical protein
MSSRALVGMTEQEVYAVLGAPLRVRGENCRMRFVQVREHVFTRIPSRNVGQPTVPGIFERSPSLT